MKEHPPLTVTETETRGWSIFRLKSQLIEVDVVPDKGGDILQITYSPAGLPLLWSTPWGLRERWNVSDAKDSYSRFMENYPGGWQTIFPNGGDATSSQGIIHDFHGEACLIPWEHKILPSGIELITSLTGSPFQLSKTISISGMQVIVEEIIRNVGKAPLDAMWVHHPAFGSPFLDGNCLIETAATSFIVDPTSSTDLVAGKGTWPYGEGPDGAVDLRVMPTEGSGIARLCYLTDFDRGWAAITNRDLGVGIEMEWAAEVLPHAWLWLEANATPTPPVNQGWYVLAIEPASGYPAHGINAARETGTLLRFEPEQARSMRIALTINDDRQSTTDTPALLH